MIQPLLERPLRIWLKNLTGVKDVAGTPAHLQRMTMTMTVLPNPKIQV